MFYDTSTHTIDAKNRVFVPRRFQRALGRDAEDNLIAFITLGFEGCIFLFSEAGFEKLRRRIDSSAFSGREKRDMQRLFFSKTQRVQLDASGRLLIPEKLRARVGIEKTVVMVGVCERAEIWAAQRWEEHGAEHDGDYDKLDRVLFSDANGSGDGDEDGDG